MSFWGPGVLQWLQSLIYFCFRIQLKQLGFQNQMDQLEKLRTKLLIVENGKEMEVVTLIKIIFSVREIKIMEEYEVLTCLSLCKVLAWTPVVGLKTR